MNPKSLFNRCHLCRRLCPLPVVSPVADPRAEVEGYTVWRSVSEDVACYTPEGGRWTGATRRSSGGGWANWDRDDPVLLAAGAEPLGAALRDDPRAPTEPNWPLEGHRRMAAANDYLRERPWPDYNKRFVVPAHETGDAFVPLGGVDLDDVLCLKEERVVGHDNGVSYGKPLAADPAGTARPPLRAPPRPRARRRASEAKVPAMRLAMRTPQHAEAADRPRQGRRTAAGVPPAFAPRWPLVVGPADGPGVHANRSMMPKVR